MLPRVPQLLCLHRGVPASEGVMQTTWIGSLATDAILGCSVGEIRVGRSVRRREDTVFG